MGFATETMTNVTVCFVNAKCQHCDGNEVKAKEVEYCIASGFVRIAADDKTYVTHISNVVIHQQI